MITREHVFGLSAAPVHVIGQNNPLGMSQQHRELLNIQNSASAKLIFIQMYNEDPMSKLNYQQERLPEYQVHLIRGAKYDRAQTELLA